MLLIVFVILNCWFIFSVKKIINFQILNDEVNKANNNKTNNKEKLYNDFLDDKNAFSDSYDFYTYKYFYNKELHKKIFNYITDNFWKEKEVLINNNYHELLKSFFINLNDYDFWSNFQKIKNSKKNSFNKLFY